MEHSKLSFMVWYKTVFLMSVTKKGFLTLEIQKQLGLKRYEPTWAMIHKLRKAMGNRDSKYTLEGMLEMDEGYFKVETSEVEKSKTKSGRGSTSVQNVAIMAESTVLEVLKTGEKQNHVRYFKAVVLEDHKAEGVNETIRKNIEESSIVLTDKSTSYVDIFDFVQIHISEKSSEQTTKETLKWVHIAISNAKRNLLDNIKLNENICKHT